MAQSRQFGVKWPKIVPVMMRRKWPRKKDAIMASPPVLGMLPEWTFRAFGLSMAPKRLPIFEARGVNWRAKRRDTSEVASVIRICMNIFMG